MDEVVSVSVRIRPSFNEEKIKCLQVVNKHPAILLVLDKSQTYHFDNVFTADENQQDIYEDTVKSLVQRVKSGYNCTVFAYGQTGTGKTYTIGTDPDIKSDNEAGLISRSLRDLFDFSDEESDVEIEVSFTEIYNEKVFDLLALNNKNPLSIKGFTVQGFNKLKVRSSFEALEHLKIGSGRRHTGETRQNSSSSRSHAIFSIYCCSRNSERETHAKLNLVDLAGCESVKKTGNQGSRFYEGININKGLLSIGQVMTALSMNSSHVPYRQSVITTILQDSLNKKNFISLIACVSANPDDLGETVQTLEFSHRVKKMKNKPEVNEFMLQFKRDNPALFMHNGSKIQTPMKRSNGFVYETPLKKPKIGLALIAETPIGQNTSNYDTASLSSFSMTSTISESQQNFSPIIRKYISAMENSIMTKIEDVIHNTLKRSTRRSCRGDKENSGTPRNTWDRLNKNISSSAMTPEDMIMTSTPDHLQIEECSNKRNYNYDNAGIDDLVIKVPTLKTGVVRRSSMRLQMKNPASTFNNEDECSRNSFHGNTTDDEGSAYNKSYNKRKVAIEEDVFKVPTAKTIISRRSSVRLQMKNQGSISKNQEDSLFLINSPEELRILTSEKNEEYAKTIRFNQSEVETEGDFVFKVPAPKNGTVQMRKQMSIPESDNTMKQRSVRLQRRKSKFEDPEFEYDSIVKNLTRRRSVRLHVKNNNTSNKENTPEIKPISRKIIHKDSSCFNCGTKKLPNSTKNHQIEMRRNEVLDILNSGTLRQIEKLHTVGVKTAEKIFLFRKMKGPFQSISELADMPYWSKKKHDKFMAENFVSE